MTCCSEDRMGGLQDICEDGKGLLLFAHLATAQLVIIDLHLGSSRMGCNEPLQEWIVDLLYLFSSGQVNTIHIFMWTCTQGMQL